MKVDELRVKLSTLEKADIIKLAIEFYKLVPKAKKEDYNLDTLINSPEEKKAKPSAEVKSVSLEEIEKEVNEFIVNAKAQYYLMPNRIISKQDRAKWRFIVKAWYKELINTKKTNWDIEKQADVIKNLYQLLCESCHFKYFSADDTFQSVGVAQIDFYRTVMQLIEKSRGKIGVINLGINLIVDNSLNSYTLYSNLMVELINILAIPDAKYKAIDLTVQLLEKNNFTVETNPKKYYNNYDSSYYYKEGKNNNLAEMGFRLHASLFEYDEAIQFYKKYAYQRDNEVKLYVLIRLLFEFKQKDYIQTELVQALKEGIKVRESLLKLKDTIEQTQTLPQYMR
jgi:hypothetical protein